MRPLATGPIGPSLPIGASLPWVSRPVPRTPQCILRAFWELWVPEPAGSGCAQTTIPRRPCNPRDWTHPPSLKACAVEIRLVGGREPGHPAAQRPPSPALCCLRGGESELHAPSTPPPPAFSLKPAFSGSLSPQEVLASSLNCSRRVEPHIPSHRPKTTSNSRVHSPAGETGYLKSETSSHIFPCSARLSNDSGLYFPNSQPGSETRTQNSPRRSLLMSASQNSRLGASGSRVPLNTSHPSLKTLRFSPEHRGTQNSAHSERPPNSPDSCPKSSFSVSSVLQTPSSS